MNRNVRLFAVFVAVVAGAALTASAGEGRIPIWAPVVIGPGAARPHRRLGAVGARGGREGPTLEAELGPRRVEDGAPTRGRFR